MSDGPVTEDGKADYDAVTARQFERREPNPSAAKWEPGELNECVCGGCHVTSTFGGVRVIVEPNLPHDHPGVMVRAEDTAYAETDPRAAALIAEQFHETYEYLAPAYGYKTREASAVAWENVPDDNKRLMVHTVANLIAEGAITPGPRL